MSLSSRNELRPSLRNRATLKVFCQRKSPQHWTSQVRISLTVSPQICSLLRMGILVFASAGCGKGAGDNSAATPPIDPTSSAHKVASQMMNENTRLSGKSVEEQMAQMVALGPGVYNIQKDKDGQDTTCIVVGQSQIISHNPEIRETAISASRQAAIWMAYAEFAKWKRSILTVHRETEAEAIQSQETVSGLQLLHISVDGDSSATTVALGWRAIPDKNQMPPLTVRTKRLFTTDPVKGSERGIESIWINGVHVIENDWIVSNLNSEEKAESHFRQRDSNGRPVVDVVMKGTVSGLETKGHFWIEGGTRIPVNVTYQDKAID